MREDHASAQPVGRVHRLPRLPGLAAEPDREVRPKEVRLLEVQPDAAVERRPLGLGPRVPRATEEVEMVPADARARLLLGAVPDAERHALMLGLSNRHARRYLEGLLVAVLGGLDVRELEELHAIQLALALAHLAAPEQIAGFVRELPLDDLLAHALVAVDLDRPEVRQRAGRGDDPETRTFWSNRLLVKLDLGVRVPAIAQHVGDALAH